MAKPVEVEKKVEENKVTTDTPPVEEKIRETKTPEEMAKEIIKDAIEPALVEISGTAKQKLDTVVRYLNRDKIQARGDNWLKKNYELLVSDTIETLINAREKAIVDYLDKKDKDDKAETFRDLIARGNSVEAAYKLVYGSK